MSEDKVIDLITTAFDSREDWQVVESLDRVVGVWIELATFLEENNIHLEHDLDESQFEDVDVSPDPDEERSEVAFILPIMDTMLQLEYTYWKGSEGYHIWVDCDFYLDDTEEDDDEDNG